MTSIFSSLEVEPAKSQQHLHPPISGLELDPFYSGLELDRNASGLEPVSVDNGLEQTPAEFYEQLGPQVLIGSEEKEVIEVESPVGLAVQEPDESLPRKKSWHRLTVALVLFMISIAIAVPVSVTQTRSSPR